MPEPTIPTDDIDALVSHEWTSHPRSAHRLHIYDSGCAICRGDVAAILAVVAPLIAEQARREERERIVAELHAEGERERQRIRELKGLGPDIDPCHVSGELNNWITAWGAAAKFVAGPQPKRPLIIRNQADTPKETSCAE